MAAAPPDLAWVWTTLMWTLSTAGALALLLWLVGDRPRGRRRCPKCWYDMTGAPGLVCPECGRDAKREGRLHKTRRPASRAVKAAVALLLAYGAVASPRVARSGWMGAVPTTVLIEGMPYFEHWIDADWVGGGTRRTAPLTTAQTLFLEFWDGRVKRDELWDWQWRRLIDVCLDDQLSERGHWARRPSFRSELEFKLVLEQPLRNPDRRPWLHHDARVELRTRDVWPEGVDVHIEPVLRRNWWKDNLRCTILQAADGRVVAERVTYEPDMCGTGVVRYWNGRTGSAGTFGPGRHTAPFNVDLDWAPLRRNEWKPARRDAAAASFEVSGSVADHMSPEESSELESLLSSGARFYFAGWLYDGTPNTRVLTVRLGDLPGYVLDTGSPTLALRAEVLRDGRVIGEADLLFDRHDCLGAECRSYHAASGEVSGIPHDVWSAFEGDGSGLSVRLTGDPVLALRDFDSNRYWDVRATLPMRSLAE